uniref:Uncharacterized protein n=1 Tax=Palpitomonas bilix TaxID=652834 RepID=A0A7S3DCK2_9EUKA
MQPTFCHAFRFCTLFLFPNRNATMTESRPAYSSVGQTMKEGEEHFKVRMQLREERLREKELPPVLPEDQVPTGKVVNVKETHGKKVDGQRIVLNDVHSRYVPSFWAFSMFST